ncbi:hypothetical protein OsI_01098 [Oryza sativa Indica Group]|uniref:Flagellin n=1 Tax=Oryza sativa subsp. indica TaxID=39946 RepID=B8ABE3_ORYSI|nr:hypothetical protein OsI_01098 [Oryza sativa Indica Group]
MASTINTNISSLTAQRNLSLSQSSLNTSIQRLSSGLRINSAKDDAAGLAISERFTSQIRGMNQAARNANDGISLSQVAESALAGAGNILQRVRELSVQSANATNSAGDRKAIQAEVGQLLSELDRIAGTTEFNGQKLLDGSFGSATFQLTASASGAATTGASAGSAGAAAGTVVIAGLQTKTVNVAASGTAADIASAVNAVADSTGVTASARNVSELKFSGTGSFSLAVKGENSTASNVTFNVTANSSAAGLAEAVKAFNDVSSQTGITAKLNSDNTGLILTNESGKDINIANGASSAAGITLASQDATQTLSTGDLTFTTATAAGTGTTVASRGTVEYNSDKGYTVSGTGDTMTTTTATTSSMKSVSTIDVSTVDGSTRALKIIDAALSAVNGQRASFGALQSRFETAIANLNTSSENMSASRSRIQDADFASETANLSRAQILQQAGTAMGLPMSERQQETPVYVTQPYLPPLEEFLPYLRGIWDRKILTNNGPCHQELEFKLQEYLGLQHISLFANGTIALVTALQALRITGEVITTPYSFVATAHSLLWNGIKPVFVDIDPQTLNLDPAKIEAAITPQTTAILPVHCYGHPCDVAAIQNIADNYGLKVIYDAAHAFGVRDTEGSILRHGDLSVLSFHATKLQHIDKVIARRADIHARYRRLLAGINGIAFIQSDAHRHNHAYFPILVGEDYPISRDALYEHLKLHGIHGRRYFHPPISSFPMYKALPSANAQNLPNAHRASASILCLPMFPALADDTVEMIAALIRDIGSGAAAA